MSEAARGGSGNFWNSAHPPLLGKDSSKHPVPPAIVESRVAGSILDASDCRPLFHTTGTPSELVEVVRVLVAIAPWDEDLVPAK